MAIFSRSAAHSVIPPTDKGVNSGLEDAFLCRNISAQVRRRHSRTSTTPEFRISKHSARMPCICGTTWPTRTRRAIGPWIAFQERWSRRVRPATCSGPKKRTCPRLTSDSDVGRPISAQSLASAKCSCSTPAKYRANPQHQPQTPILRRQNEEQLDLAFRFKPYAPALPR